MKKIIFAIVILICILMAFARPKPSNELVFWTLQMNDYKEYIEGIIAEYESGHDVKIKWVDVPFSEGEKRTLSAILSDNPPDLINLNPDFSVMLAQKGALTYVDKGLLKDFTEEVVESLSYEGNVYGIPWYATSAVTFYNSSYVKKSPSRFEELQKLSKGLDVYVYMPTISENDTMLKILNKYGVNSFENINSDESVKVFEMFKKMYDAGGIPKESVTQTHREALEKYMSGQVAIFQGGANFLNMIKENAPDVYNHTEVAPQIKGSIGQNDFSLMNLVVPLRAKHSAEAIDFGLFLTNEKNQLELAKLTNIIATNKNALKDEFYNKVNGNLTEKARSISAKQLANVVPVMRQHKNQKEINTLVNTAVQNILIDNADIKKTLDELALNWQSISE